MEKTNLTGGRLLARNTVWNLAGQILPMLVAVVAIPPLVRAMGVARFGILSLAWTIIGYFSLFDLGIGRAVTKLIAEKLGADEESVIAPLAWTSLFLLLLLGAVGALVLLGISTPLINKALRIPSSLRQEAVISFYWLSFSIPIITVTSGLRGILEAQQRFRIVNLIRIPMSIFSFAGPLLVIPFSASLVPVILILVAGRSLGAIIHFIACLKTTPDLRSHFEIDRSSVMPLLKFGGWMTATNLIGTLMLYVDRFLIGGILSIAAVAYYTAPFDMVLRLTSIPTAVVGVMFPAFAVTFIQDQNRTGVLLLRSLKYIFIVMFPIVLTLVIFAPEILMLWLGPLFSLNGAAVLRWLAAGVFVNSLSTIAFILIQGAGRPDITAKLQLFELPIYFVALWALTKHYGIEGTAIAWTGRITFDAILLFIFGAKLVPTPPKFVLNLVGSTISALIVLMIGSLSMFFMLKIFIFLVVLIVFTVAIWIWGLAPVERGFLFRARS